MHLECVIVMRQSREFQTPLPFTSCWYEILWVHVWSPAVVTANPHVQVVDVHMDCAVAP